MSNEDNLIDLTELLNQTELKEPYVRKCLRELKPFLKPHIERGDNNRILFSSNATAIFIKIREEKMKGVSLSTIKKRLFSEDEITRANSDANKVKEVDEPPLKLTQTESNVNEILDLKDRLHKIEIEKNEAEHKLELLKNSLKFLPSGEPETLKQGFNRLLELSTTLEIQTRGFFGQRKKNLELWDELKQILRGKNTISK